MVVFWVRLMGDDKCAACGRELATGGHAYWSPSTSTSYCCAVHARAAGATISH